MRAARAEVDLGAIAHNVRTLRDLVAPAELAVVVKADGYGHGAVAVGQAALGAGASWLGVALVEEGAVLRKAGISAPILLLSEPRATDIDAAVRWDLRLSVYTARGIDAAAAAARAAGKVAPLHLKVNTGMNRVGAERGDVVSLAKEIAGHPELELEALWTHCAVADEPGNPFTDEQLDRFEAVRAELDEAGLAPAMLHAANTAAAIEHPRSRYDLVRAGIGVYGISPSPALEGRVDLRPALSLRAEVSMVKRVAAGQSISYGLRHRFERDTVVATVPIGYADGVPRRLSSAGGEVLVGGRRRTHRGGGDHGSAHGGLRHRRRGGGRRGRAAGPPGRRGRPGRRVGRPPRHHRVRGGVRHRAPGSPLLRLIHHGSSGRPRQIPGDARRIPGRISGWRGGRQRDRWSAPAGSILACPRSKRWPSRPTTAPGARSRPGAPTWCSAWVIPTPTWCSWGRGPGAEEDRQGLPFVGRSGQLLDKLMAEELGMTRDQAYIANVVKCRPPDNRDPRPEEIAACRPYLEAQLELIGPRVVVTLGKFAGQLLLGSTVGITKLRGRSYPFGDAVLVPTLHPAYALRGGGGVLAQMRADLVRAKQALEAA